MNKREITQGVLALGAQDWDRRLFDELIPLPDGTSYNVYLVQGDEKSALIDTVDPTKEDLLLAQLANVSHIDYLIVQHVEQDHSGALPKVLQRFPDAQVVCSPKAKSMVVSHLRVPGDQITTVEDSETIDLGNRTLEFIHAPWVHWPETMLTYVREDKVLFTCDLFGSHLASSQLYVEDQPRVYEAAKRYYAEIMMPFAELIKRHLERLADYEIDIIAPSHGPLHNDPPFIINAYHDWVLGAPKNLVVLPYTSMHGSTQVMVDRLIASFVERNVEVRPFNMTVADIGEVAISLVDAATIVFGTPTVLTGPHPNIVSTAYLAAALRPKAKFAAVIGSYGWAGKAAETIVGLTSRLNIEWLDSVMVKGLPSEGDVADLDNLADLITKKHKEL